MSDFENAKNRLARIKPSGKGYGDSVLNAYQYDEKGLFYLDLAIVLGHTDSNSDYWEHKYD